MQLLSIKLFGQTGDFKSVEAALKKLVELTPQEPGYRKLLINFYVEQRRIEDAEGEMRALAAANPADSTATLDLIRFLYAIKRAPAAARQELNARISAGGEVFPLQIALAEMDLAEGNLTDGKQSLENLVNTGKSAENVRTARITLGQMYLGQRNFGRAETLANDILRDDPHNVAALKLRASVRIERAQLDAAVADLLDALNHQPRSTEIMSLLATAYERSGLIELADKQFADATKASDFDAKVGLEYVGFLQRRGSIARAEDILAGLNNRRPNDIQVLSTLAQVRLARQNWIGAQEIAESIRRIGNNGATADQILGTALIGRNKYDEAIAAHLRGSSLGRLADLIARLLKPDWIDLDAPARLARYRHHSPVHHIRVANKQALLPRIVVRPLDRQLEIFSGVGNGSQQVHGEQGHQ